MSVNSRYNDSRSNQKTASKTTIVNLTALESLKLQTAGTLRSFPGAKIHVVFDAHGGNPESITLLDLKSRPISKEDLNTMTSLDSRMKKFKLGKDKDSEAPKLLEIAFANGGTLSTVLVNVSQAVNTIEARTRNLERFLTAMEKAEDLAAGDPLARKLWCFICSQSTAALEAVDAYLTATCQETAVQKIQDFFKTKHVTAWFIKSIFREETLDLEGKTKLCPLLLYPRSIYFSTEETSYADVAELHNVVCFDVMPRPTSEADLLQLASELEAEKYHKTCSDLDKKKILEDFTVAQYFPTAVQNHVGKSKADVLYKASDTPLHPKTPGDKNFRELQRLAFLSMVAGNCTKSSSDGDLTMAVVGFDLPPNKTLQNINDLGSILNANPSLVSAFLKHNLSTKDVPGGTLTQKGKLLNRGVAGAIPALKTEVLRKASDKIAEHHIYIRDSSGSPTSWNVPTPVELTRPTVHAIKTYGSKAEGFQDFLIARKRIAPKGKAKKKSLAKGRLFKETEEIIDDLGGLPNELKELIGLIKNQQAQIAAANHAGRSVLGGADEDSDEGGGSDSDDYL